MKRALNIVYIIILQVFISSICLHSEQTEQIENPIDRLRQHMRYLASEELEGRFPGTDGIEKAADYIGNYFKQLNLYKFNNSYYQEFDVITGLQLGTNNQLSATVLVERAGVPKEMWRPGVRNFQPEEDWQPLVFSENGNGEGDLVFVGYGITAEKLNYDDYKDIDVKGKVVIILDGSPEGSGDGTRFSNYLSLRYKAVMARNYGAKAVLFVSTQGDSADVLRDVRYELMTRNSGIIAAHIKRSVISRLFPRHLQLNAIEREINSKKKPNSFEIPNTSISLTVDLENKFSRTRNVVGFVKGTKYPDEYIVLGAHYDHLGWGQLGNSSYTGRRPMIHFGADDNASGVAGIIELAQRFANQPAERSIVFVAFSAEEMGLLGSAHFVDNPPYTLNNTFMMLNFDMIGRMRDNKINVFGLGSSNAFGYVDSLAALSSVDLVKLQDGFGPSDHTSFYKNKIPVMHLFTGTHTDYHKPSDTFDKINFEGQSKIVDFAENVIRHYATYTNKITFEEVTQSSSEHQGRERRAHGSDKGWFGIVPNFEESPLGCKISGASPGSPAQAAGFQENDIITHINDKQVKNLHDFMYIIGEYNAGDELEVRFLRNNKEHTVKVTLATRR